jgi:hypothetical protein
MKKSLIEVVRSHTGSVLIGGALSLKVATLTGSWIFLTGGYAALILVVGVQIKNWRDKR